MSKLKGETGHIRALQKYMIKDHEIYLPVDHKLPAYQQTCRLYDKFLPILASHIINPEKYIVDVGANVGDTAVALMQSCKNPIICIEGVRSYFLLLQDNVKLLGDAGSRISCIETVIGTGRFAGVMTADGSTGHLDINSVAADAFAARPLDDILSELDVQNAVALLKVDTDGYDSDVLVSAASTIEASKPLIFWENYFSNENEKSMLEELYSFLKSNGYTEIFIFDNFGNLLASHCNFNLLRDINAYVESQYKHECTRSFYYTDVLAVSPENSGIALKAIASFRKFIEKK